MFVFTYVLQTAQTLAAAFDWFLLSSQKDTIFCIVWQTYRLCPVFSEVCSLVEVVGVEGVRHLLARIHKAVRDRVSRILRNTFQNLFLYASL